MDKYRKKKLLKIRASFVERYKLAKQRNDKYYTKYFAKQIHDIDNELMGDNCG